MYNRKNSVMVLLVPIQRESGWEMTEENQTPQEQVDLLVAIILASEQVGELIQSNWYKTAIRFTLVNTSGGVFQTGSTCMLVGIPTQLHADLMDMIETVCHTRTALCARR